MACAGKDRPRGLESRATVERLEGRQLLTATLDTLHGGEAGTDADLLAASVAEAAVTLKLLLAAAPTTVVGGSGAEAFTLPSGGDILISRRTELPCAAAPELSLSTDRVTFDEPVGGGMSPLEILTLRNTGPVALTIPAEGLSIVGAQAALFQILFLPELPVTLPPGGSLDVPLVYTPGTGESLGAKRATLCVLSTDPALAPLDVPLRGVAAGGGKDPSLRRILYIGDTSTNGADPETDPDLQIADAAGLPDPMFAHIARLIA